VTYRFTPTGPMQEETRGPRSAEGAQAQARSRLYSLVGRAFAPPNDTLYEELTGGAWERQVAEATAALPFSLSLADLTLRPEELGSKDLQAEYVRLFEVGLMGGPPCSLFAGHHETDRLRVMEELVRFYSFFDLRLTPGRMPDHITVELEFMQFLAFREAEAIEQGNDRESCLRAQRDFLKRQLGRFLARLSDKVRAHKPLPFFEGLIELGHRFAQEDHGYIVATLAAGPPS
jgi:DMSO reductase family type II enzyme chaperone